MRIETERLLLREFEPSDLKNIHEYACDPEVAKYMLWGPNSEKDTREFLDRCIQHKRDKPRQVFDLAVTVRDNDKLIGSCGITLMAHDKRQGAVGYCYNKQFWRQGFGVEACRAMINFGFRELGLHRIFATCDAENTGSAAVLRKAGMRQEAHFLEDRHVKGVWRDTLLFAQLKREWEVNQGA